MADVCLILEGTYPYVTGGVSTWTHNLIKALKDIQFSLLLILPTRNAYQTFKYSLPSNVENFTEVYIHERELSTHKNPGPQKLGYDAIHNFYRGLSKSDFSAFPDLYRWAIDPNTRVVSPHDLFYGKKSWEMLLSLYQHFGANIAFVDFFWSWRYAHLPLLRLADAPIPTANVYHPISTGYAGLAATLAKHRTGAPIVLSEHGIYTNERRIEIEKSEYFDSHAPTSRILDQSDNIKTLWIQLFELIGKLTYQHCSDIVTLFENNRKMQIAGGANPAISRIIPNGINLNQFSRRKTNYAFNGAPKIGMVGRVVPIKDVKTFLRACRIVLDQRPEVQIYIIGPTDEEPEYVAECRELADALELGNSLEFTGPASVTDWYPKLDVLVLTSASEGQPLSIMEAHAMGLPCVASDVGACSELLEGKSQADYALGASGIVTPIANPSATAEAVLNILEDDALRESMGQAGYHRVRRFYDEREVAFSYLELYRKHTAFLW